MKLLPSCLGPVVSAAVLALSLAACAKQAEAPKAAAAPAKAALVALPIIAPAPVWAL